MHCRSCGGLLKLKDVIEHGRTEKRMSCVQCETIFYNNPVPVVMCLVEKTLQNGQTCVLMTRNVDAPSQMPLVFVAGFLEATDKSPASGMARELSEEVNLSIAEERLRLLGVAMFHRMNQLSIVFTVRLESNEEPVRNEKELAEMRWVPLHKLNLGRWSEGPAKLVKDWVAERLRVASKL
jgi:NADH pyrophosphatase NudC (nudix superfamily)